MVSKALSTAYTCRPSVAAFASAFIQGALLALLLGGGALVYFVCETGFSTLDLFSPLALVGLMIFVLLCLFIPLYLIIGTMHARAVSLQRALKAYVSTFGPQLVDAIVTRVESTPLPLADLRIKNLLSADSISAELGEGKMVRNLIGLVLKRVPSDFLPRRQQSQTEPETVVSGAEGQFLRNMLTQCIEVALQGVTTSSRRRLCIAIVVHTFVLGAAIFILPASKVAEPAEPELSKAEFLLRNAPPEQIFKGTLAGKNLHLVVYNCAAYELKGESKIMEAIKLFETDFYPFSTCHLESLTVEKGAITIELGRLAFGAGGCCTSRASYRTTDGVKWKDAWKKRNG